MLGLPPSIAVPPARAFSLAEGISLQLYPLIVIHFNILPDTRRFGTWRRK
jgi:hypothetical protein